MILVEAIACGPEDARIAQDAGVHRLEICSALSLGGLTPSIGAVRAIRSATALPLMAMVRPRQGGFCYSSSEFEVMCYDAEALFDEGVDGLVFGVLSGHGELDIQRSRQLISCGQWKQTVFHRAFDAVRDPFATLEALIDLGITRVLTSGQAASALGGADLIRALIERAEGRIEILPAGGIRPSNVGELLAQTGAAQVHLGPFVNQAEPHLAGTDVSRQAFGGSHPIADGATLRQVARLLTVSNI